MSNDISGNGLRPTGWPAGTTPTTSETNPAAATARNAVGSTAAPNDFGMTVTANPYELNWVPDLMAAAADPNIQVDLGTLGGSVPFPPTTENGTHPMGSLKVKNGVIETAGGYKIEQLGKFEWKVTGPDGKHTRIWGDPHVDEGDGGKWDFKRDATFVLGDGTQIHCKTVPYGNGMTVTGELEVVSGNERVKVTDIDKGKGKVGEVTQDGYSRAGHLESDVFVMGDESDDWALKGNEIIGSRKGGEEFKTGNFLMVGYADWNVAENRFFKGFHGSADPLDEKQFLDYYNQVGAGRGRGLVGNNGKEDNGHFFVNNFLDRAGTQEGNAFVAVMFRQMAAMMDIINQMTSLRDQAQRQRVY